MLSQATKLPYKTPNRIKSRHMPRRHFYLFAIFNSVIFCFLCLFPVRAKKCLVERGSSCYHRLTTIAMTNNHSIHFLRGGDGGNEEENKNDDHIEDEASHTPSHRFWSSTSLYRMNENMMADALSQKIFNEDNNVGSKKEELHNRENQQQQQQQQQQQKDKLNRAQNGRGGAFTTEKTPQQPKSIKNGRKNSHRNGFFRWLAPPSTQATTTQKRRRDEKEISTKEYSKNSDSQEESITGKKDGSMKRSPKAGRTSTYSFTSATQSDLAKLWWVNVWTQQLPDRPGESPDKNKSSTTEEEDKRYEKAFSENSTLPANYRDVDNPNGITKRPSRKERAKIEKEAKNENERKADIVPKTLAIEQKYEDSVNNASSTERLLQADYVSTGVWAAIDGVTSLGLSRIHPAFRISRPLRPIRKVTAQVTGLHGALSGKPKMSYQRNMFQEETLADEDLAKVRRRIAAINRARVGVERLAKSDGGKKKGRWWGRGDQVDVPEVKNIGTFTTSMAEIASMRKTPDELEEERRRKERVQEIDKLMLQAQRQLQQLVCEKDELQRRPNPLWNYTTTETSSRKHENQTTITTRRFNFPPDDLVDEYLDFLLSTGRLIKLNHTDLWQNDVNLDDDDDAESTGDEFSEDEVVGRRKQRNDGNGGGGSWLLRQSLGKGSTLGEKIGEAAEQAAYKSTAKAIMEVLAKSISAIHGVNIMAHTDIRLSMEQTPDLPPMSRQGIIPGGRNPNYARDALQGAMRRGARKNREKSYGFGLSDEHFVQRDAVVETLLSHCQISAPLLKLFPLAWQRAMLGNIITLVTAVIADFLEGVQFEILGHRLSFSFKPITETDMINHLAIAGTSFHGHRVRSKQFESAVQATADDLSENLKFLDRWHERALGSGVLRAQLANLIARLVLTLSEEVLNGAKMDLWAAQAGGPRMVAGLEFRTTDNYMDPII